MPRVPPTSGSEILARIWHSDLHFPGYGGTQPHTRLRGKITKATHYRRSQTLICGFERGTAGTRTQDRRIMSPARQQVTSGCLTWADMRGRDHGYAHLGTYLA